MNKLIPVICALAGTLATTAEAAGADDKLVILKSERPMLRVYAWERWGNFINALPGDGKEIPYDAAKLNYRLYVFPYGEMREIDFADGVRTHDHINMTDIVQYTWTGRRVQFAQHKAEKQGPGDAALHPKGIFHHGEALEPGKTIEFAYYVENTLNDPQVTWLNTGTNPMEVAAAWEEQGVVHEATGGAVARAPRQAARFDMRSYDFGKYVTRELHLAKGTIVPVKSDREHMMYVLSGKVKYTIGSQNHELGSEDAARIPAGRLRNCRDTVRPGDREAYRQLTRHRIYRSHCSSRRPKPGCRPSMPRRRRLAQ
jgi:quercetin dioxygenase-like cupin family protein